VRFDLQPAAGNLQPSFQILLEAFLGFQIRRDDDHWPVRKDDVEQSGEKRLRRRTNPGARQRSAMLQSPREGLHGGSLRDVSEQIACRRRCRVLRQAE
jgi:hypothetical protein